ncbi:MAG: tRNA (adenosine(37)-N6)-dimethylallyltransferase MiaA [Hyphomicrobiaceae bacterium]|nr:tRNA (adenosine(37)-N6)-dimethylallyltransferase MiaA [Hyphomicrobiaceae bacterium]
MRKVVIDTSGVEAVLIAGPTASGKSAFALALAQSKDGVIINADSMQVYAEMRVLTARPSPDEEALVPHRLYGHVSARESYSVGRWLDEVATEIAAAKSQGRLPIIVGGTGLYFNALLEGLSPIPPIPDDIRSHWRAAGAVTPAAELHAELTKRDSLTASQLIPTDRQRIVRALEVIDATGRPLAEWQKIRGQPLLAADQVAKLVIAPPRNVIYDNCERRFRHMVEQGALDEADRMRRMQLPGDMPAMGALGLSQLVACLRGEMSREAAIQAATQQTRRYIKRQLTWLNRYMISWKRC